MVGLKILVPDTTKPGRIYEAYNGNVWLYYVWKRSNMVYCSFWIILFCVALIQFSFANVFSDNIYIFIVVFKLVGVAIEKFLIKGMDETLLVLPLGITVTTILGLITFGSSDFLAFIQSYFIEFAMSLFERNY